MENFQKIKPSGHIYFYFYSILVKNVQGYVQKTLMSYLGTSPIQKYKTELTKRLKILNIVLNVALIVLPLKAYVGFVTFDNKSECQLSMQDSGVEYLLIYCKMIFEFLESFFVAKYA